MRLICTQALATESQCNTHQTMTSVDTNVGVAEQRCSSYHHGGPHAELHPWEQRERTVSFTAIKLGWAGREKPVGAWLRGLAHNLDKYLWLVQDSKQNMHRGCQRFFRFITLHPALKIEVVLTLKAGS